MNFVGTKIHSIIATLLYVLCQNQKFTLAVCRLYWDIVLAALTGIKSDLSEWFKV